MNGMIDELGPAGDGARRHALAAFHLMRRWRNVAACRRGEEQNIF